MGKRDNYNGYMAEYMLRRYHIRRAIAIEQLGGVCVVWGSTDDLEIDHIDPSKKSFNVSKSVSWRKFKEELAKCQLLCKTHHIEKTTLDKGQTPAKGTHGTLSSYRYCRCDPCREAKRAYMREWRKSH